MAEKNNITINLTELKAALFDKCVMEITKNADDDNCCIVATNMLVANEIITMIERLNRGC